MPCLISGSRIAEAELPSCPASGSCGSHEMLVATRRASSQPSCVIRCPAARLQRAADAERRSFEATLPIQRTDYETMASSWRHLARSYEFVESLERFLFDALKAKMPPPRATAE
jgi:hypothetical protein